MARKTLSFACFMLLLIVVYFLVWPTPIEPVSWQSPPSPGYTGPFTPNNRLKGLEFLNLGGYHGPEDIAVDDKGRIYAATAEGVVVRLRPDGSSPKMWADTKGRPLGIDFDAKGNLIVADGIRGLLSIDSTGRVTELVSVVDGVSLGFADDVDIARDGKIYFSDASSKFSLKGTHGSMEASLLDIMEHGGHGRLLMYDPTSGKAKTLLKGLNFANGVAVDPNQKFVLVNETGTFRVLRYWLEGPKKGKAEPLIEALPGFPDNISTGLDGRFWIALISPRNDLLDSLSDKPFIRKVVQRMPKFLRPKAESYGHVVAVDARGKVLEDLQNPETDYPRNTSVTETKDYLYIGSLTGPVLARLSKAKAGIR
jgi:sugar lactone lactonase YvrE